MVMFLFILITCCFVSQVHVTTADGSNAVGEKVKVHYSRRQHGVAFEKHETVGTSGIVEFSLPALPIEVKTITLYVSKR